MVMTRDDMRMIVGVLLAPLRARLDSMIRRTTISGATESDGLQATAVTTFGEEHEGAEVLEPYGFASQPPDGSEGVLLCPGGNAGHPIVMSVGQPSTRLTGLADAESAIFVGTSVGDGARVVCRAAGGVEAQPKPGSKVRLGAALPAPALPVARATDPTLLNAFDLASLNALITAWNATQPLGGPIVALPGVTLAPVTGTGTITAGGTGSEST
jgi:phage gp45-like